MLQHFLWMKLPDLLQLNIMVLVLYCYLLSQYNYIYIYIYIYIYTCTCVYVYIIYIYIYYIYSHIHSIVIHSRTPSVPKKKLTPAADAIRCQGLWWSLGGSLGLAVIAAAG